MGVRYSGFTWCRVRIALTAWQWSLGAVMVVAALDLAGCSTISKPGKQVYYLVACGGGATGVPNICYAKAEELCSGDYTVLSGDPPDSNDPQTIRVACRKQSATR